MQRTVAVVLLMLLAPISHAAFNVEGFVSNMPRTIVLAQAEKLYKVSASDDEETYIARTADGSSYISFNFCEDKLVAVQQGFPASLRQVTLLISEFKAKHGNPFSTNAGIRAHSTGTVYEWGTWWSAGLDFVSIYYMGTELGESLTTSHQIKNKCFKVPR